MKVGIGERAARLPYTLVGHLRRDRVVERGVLGAQLILRHHAGGVALVVARISVGQLDVPEPDRKRDRGLDGAAVRNHDPRSHRTPLHEVALLIAGRQRDHSALDVASVVDDGVVDVLARAHELVALLIDGRIAALRVRRSGGERAERAESHRRRRVAASGIGGEVDQQERRHALGSPRSPSSSAIEKPLMWMFSVSHSDLPSYRGSTFAWLTWRRASVGSRATAKSPCG